MQENIENKEINEKMLEIEYNGERRMLDIQSAAELCKEAFEYQTIKKNYDRLLNIAKADEQSVTDFLCTLENTRAEKRKEELVELCGGNREIAEHIIALEAAGKPDSRYEEFKDYFPDIDINTLPESVIKASKQNNTKLLDEFLRYTARRDAEQNLKDMKRKQNAFSSIGSLANTDTSELSVERTEFLKGLWR